MSDVRIASRPLPNANSSQRDHALARLQRSDVQGVEVWQGSLDLDAPELAKQETYLSPDERERAARFRFRLHRDRFVAARGLVRSVLGRYLDCNPAALAFEYSPFGKPSLRGNHSLEFNLAHSENHFALAISNQPVGIDLEVKRCIPDRQLLAREVFSERESLKRAPLSEEAFLRLWTRKEALLKGIGCGITEHVKNVSVFFDDAGEVLVPPELSSSFWLIRTYCDGPIIWSLALIS